MARQADVGRIRPGGSRWRHYRPSRAATAAHDIGFPVALKAVGADIAHKTEIGAVKLDLSSQREVRDAAKVLAAHSTELLVERMAIGGVAELIIGIAGTLNSARIWSSAPAACWWR